MGTRGYQAFRYKTRYYRNYIRSVAYPSEAGISFAQQIPWDYDERDGWIQRVINTIEEEEAWRKDRENGEYADDGDDDGGDSDRGSDKSEPYLWFEDILDYNDWVFPGIGPIEWTYVIDLDNRAFTVNGVVHFNLDNMPYEPGFDAYFDGYDVLPVPKEHLTTARQWPAPSFNVDVALQIYESLQPRVLELEQWGAPTWDTLSPAQRLAVQIVDITILDNHTLLGAPDLSNEWPNIASVCWKLACAAAPSHLLCPAAEPSMFENILYASHNRSDETRYWVTAEHMHHIYCWFRGCLITFCIRLDEDPYVKHEVGLMVKYLRNHGRTSGLGIVMSSHQIVAVSVNGPEIRHSPALDIHDASWSPGRDPQINLTLGSGLLLLMHLLSPALTAGKTPWSASLGSRYNNRSALPEDIIRHILHFIDDDTYHFVLPLVSRLVRSYCLDHPRIGDYTLVGVNSDNSFNVLHHSTGTRGIRAELVRTNEKVQYTLLNSFQHHQTGIGAYKNTSDSVVNGLNSHFGRYLDWRRIVQGTDLPEMRIQVVNGMWSMVEVGHKND
ncbi:hypothetical protein FRC06_005984 [Ceratobasidium sp. 370]|nr:hypothetical protein FRC06_005984 [Ceratobasidium sp. 370]